MERSVSLFHKAAGKSCCKGAFSRLLSKEDILKVGPIGLICQSGRFTSDIVYLADLVGGML